MRWPPLAVSCFLLGLTGETCIRILASFIVYSGRRIGHYHRITISRLSMAYHIHTASLLKAEYY